MAESIIDIAKNQQILVNANRQSNIALGGYAQDRPNIYAQRGYNAELGKMLLVSSNGLTSNANVLTSTLPLQRGKSILANGHTGLF